MNDHLYGAAATGYWFSCPASTVTAATTIGAPSSSCLLGAGQQICKSCLDNKKTW